jgi:hypothetical protein
VDRSVAHALDRVNSSYRSEKPFGLSHSWSDPYRLVSGPRPLRMDADRCIIHLNPYLGDKSPEIRMPLPLPPRCLQCPINRDAGGQVGVLRILAEWVVELDVRPEDFDCVRRGVYDPKERLDGQVDSSTRWIARSTSIAFGLGPSHGGAGIMLSVQVTIV